VCGTWEKSGKRLQETCSSDKKSHPLGRTLLGESQINLHTLALKVGDARRQLSSTIKYLSIAKKVVECHVARKVLGGLVEAAQEAARTNNFAEADLMCRWLSARAAELGQLIGSKRGTAYPQDVAMLQEAKMALEKLESRRLQLRQI
jgi:hypothetical protein